MSRNFYIVKRDFVNSRNTIIGKFGSHINALLSMEDEAFKFVIANKGIYDKIYSGIGINDRIGKNEHFICKGDLPDELFIYQKKKDCGYIYNSFTFVKLYSLVVCEEFSDDFLDYRNYYVKFGCCIEDKYKECMSEVFLDINNKGKIEDCVSK